jgi:hypothetical protein
MIYLKRDKEKNSLIGKIRRRRYYSTIIERMSKRTEHKEEKTKNKKARKRNN